MISPLGRSIISCSIIIVFAALVFPVQAASPAQQTGLGPRSISGSYQTTNPIYPLLDAETGILLYDMTGEVLQDFDFYPLIESQVLGTLDGNIVSGEYRIELPETPRGNYHDFDGDATTPPAVQVFAPATYINFLGDRYINRGESALVISARIDPLTFHVIGGHVVVWAEHDGEMFPGSLGPDGATFTSDDPLMELPAGWSIVSMETDPFTIIRDQTVTIPLIESLGDLNDYSELSYTEAWQTLFERMRVTYPFTTEKNLDWDAIYNEMTPKIQAATSDIEFHLSMTHLGTLIPDTHLNYASIPVIQQFLMGGIGITALAVTDDEAVIVMDVTPDSLAAEAGIQVGDSLITVDGLPALQYLDETPLWLRGASTIQARRQVQAQTMLLGLLNSDVTLTWHTPGGVEDGTLLIRELDSEALWSLLGGDMLMDEVITAQMMDSGVGYIRVSNFVFELSRADAWFSAELQTLIDAGAQGIIIDMRDNGGGLVPLAMAMAGHFFQDYERMLDFYYADGTGDFAYRGFVEILTSTPYYDAPVAILINEQTVSSGELFAYAMQTDQRAMVVGHTPSSGAAGEVGDGQYLLPGGLMMQVPTGRSVHPITGKTLIEGVGIIPDILVPRTREALLSPEDEVLLAAEAALLGR